MAAKSKILAVFAFIMFAPASMAAVNVTAEFSGIENGRAVPDLSEGPVFPGDGSSWLITFQVNETADTWLVLSKTADEENTCEEPENEDPSICGNSGELDESVELSGFFDSNSNFEYDSSQETLFDIGEGENMLGNTETSNGSFEANTEYELIVNWSIPLAAGSNFMTDSLSYNLTIAANESVPEQVSSDTESSGEGGSVGTFQTSTTSTASLGSVDDGDNQNDEDNTTGTTQNGSLNIVVTDSDGNPMNATAMISGADLQKSTDQDGEARFELEPGNYSINVSSSESDSSTVWAIVEEDINSSVEVQLSSASAQTDTETEPIKEDSGNSLTGAFTGSTTTYASMIILFTAVILLIWRKGG